MRNTHQMGWPSEEIYIAMPRSGRRPSSSPLLSEESALDHEVGLLTTSNQNRHHQPSFDCPPSLQAIASGAQHSESSAAYFRWPPLSRIHGTAEERSAYFSGLQKEMHTEGDERAPLGPQACTLLDLMTIRAFHSKLLRQFSLGTAIGFRTTRGMLTDIPAIIVFVAHKVHKEWLLGCQKLPPILEGPGGIWCDVDVVEFLYYGAPAVAIKEQVYTELVEGLRGNSPCIGPGSQVASQETYGTLGAIVQSKTGLHQVGFLTNRHVAVDLDYPNQKMFHPLPPNLGPGVYLGAVERATSFITDDLWYGIFASMNSETFVRADGAFIPFGDCFDMSRVETTVKGVGDVGEVMNIDLQAPIGSIVGRQVVKVGRSSGLTKGSIMAYALEYNDEKGICFFTDFLIVGENNQAFDSEGDSGSLILTTEDGGKPRPVGIIWGGMANRGRLKLRNGYRPESWTSGVDLGRLLDLLQLSLITTGAGLAAAAEEQGRLIAGLAMESIVEETSGGMEHESAEARTLESEPGDGGALAQQEGAAERMHEKAEAKFLGLVPPDQALISEEAEGKGSMLETLTAMGDPGSSTKVLELLDFGFAPKPGEKAPIHSGEASVKDGDDGHGEEISFGLNLFDSREPKRRRPSTPTDS